jgi:hypothetical protein
MTELLMALAAMSAVSFLVCLYALVASRIKRLRKIVPLLGVVAPKEDAYGPITTKKKKEVK